MGTLINYHTECKLVTVLKRVLENLNQRIKNSLSVSGRHRVSIIKFTPPVVIMSPKEPKQLQNLFIKGLSFETTDESLRSHGECSQIVWCWRIQTLSAPETLGLSLIPLWRRWMQPWNVRPHKVNGKVVELKRAVSKEDS